MKSDEIGNQDRQESVCADVKSKCDTHLQSNVRVRPARGSPYPQYEDYVWLLSLMRYATKTDMSRFVQMLSQMRHASGRVKLVPNSGVKNNSYVYIFL